jgi:hypothetical protein
LLVLLFSKKEQGIQGALKQAEIAQSTQIVVYMYCVIEFILCFFIEEGEMFDRASFSPLLHNSSLWHLGTDRLGCFYC